MSSDFKAAVAKGRENAVKHNDSTIRLEHIVYGILSTENIVQEIVKEKTDGISTLLSDINDHNKQITVQQEGEYVNGMIGLDEEVQKMIEKIDADRSNVIDVDNFILSVLEKDLKICKILKEYAITKTWLERKLNKFNVSSFGDDEHKPTKMAEQKKNTKTPILDNFGRDLTTLAQAGKLDPVVGREGEVERVAQILTRRKKNNPILIGDPGVGKTAIAEGLAIRISKKECAPNLQGKRIVALEMTNMVAGTKYRGQFEERMKGLLEELRDNKNIILFIDEMHTVVGAGNGSGSLDAANIFKPALSRGEVQCIGATTLDEFREHIEKDGALERRFQKVQVNPTTLEETKEILINIKEKYEEFHNVTYTPEAIDEIIRLADRYITTREFPDKAIDIMDECGSRTQISIKKPEEIRILEKKIEDLNKKKIAVVKSQQFEEAAELRDNEKKLEDELKVATDVWKRNMNIAKMIVDDVMVAEVVSLMTQIPISKVSQNEAKKLMQLETELSGCVIGQEEAIKTVTSAIKRNRAGIRKKNRPIGTFMFVGSTGVGKTKLAKNLAKKVFGSEESLIRIDMTEYQESHTVSRLIGAPPGYVGYNEGGQLTEKVRNKPYSVVLLDEIEKAHPKVFDLFLQMIDDGHLTDGLGRQVNFKNTIIIMTSNVGVRQSINFAAGIGFSSGNNEDSNRQMEILKKELKKAFKPEFLNRVDDIVYFNNLTEEKILQIVGLEFKELTERLKEDSNYVLTIGDGIAEYIQKNGFDKDMGAREMQRTIQKLIEDPISDALLSYGMPATAHITVKFDEKEEKVLVEVTSE